MRNSYLTVISCLASIAIVYMVLFIHTFFNFHNEFKFTFKSLENLNFHEKYSKKVHHIRQEKVLDWLWKKPKVEDLMFTTINKLEDKELIVLIQGDSYMEQLTNSSYYVKDTGMELLTNEEKPKNISVELVQKFKSKKKVGFVSGGTGSYSPSVMNLQLDVLEQDFKILPNVVIAYVDQSDIGDENCRYKNNKTYKNGILKSVRPETYLMYRDLYNYSQIYRLSEIFLKNSSKTLKTFQLINYKFKYNLIKSSLRFYRKNISNSKMDKDRLIKCRWKVMEKYLIMPSESDVKYFENSIKRYLKKIDQKKHIKKLILVTFPHKKHFYSNSDQITSYKFNVSDAVDNVIQNKKNITHINFSKMLLNDKYFDYENIWISDNVHLNPNAHGNIFFQKILDELSKYLQ